jgi:hypothetical protein
MNGRRPPVPAKRARKKMKSDFDKPRLRAHTSSSSGSPLVKLERVLGARTLPELTQTTSDICDLLLQHDLRRKTFHAKCSSSRSLIARRTVAISQVSGTQTMPGAHVGMCDVLQLRTVYTSFRLLMHGHIGNLIGESAARGRKQQAHAWPQCQCNEQRSPK